MMFEEGFIPSPFQGPQQPAWLGWQSPHIMTSSNAICTRVKDGRPSAQNPSHEAGQQSGVHKPLLELIFLPIRERECA